MEGQLWPEERKFLCTAIAETKPHLVLEVGTWKGGGSTLQIANGLKENGTGKLITCELDSQLFAEANKIYDNDEWKSIVTCLNKKSNEVIAELLYNDNIPDFLFFDGPNDPDVTFDDFKLIEPRMQIGSHFSMHDFITVRRSDGLTAKKALKIRPYLEASKKWKLIHILEEPHSVGICLFRRVL